MRPSLLPVTASPLGSWTLKRTVWDLRYSLLELSPRDSLTLKNSKDGNKSHTSRYVCPPPVDLLEIIRARKRYEAASLWMHNKCSTRTIQQSFYFHSVVRCGSPLPLPPPHKTKQMKTNYKHTHTHTHFEERATKGRYFHKRLCCSIDLVIDCSLSCEWRFLHEILVM